MIESLKKIKAAEKKATARIEAAKKESESLLNKANDDAKTIMSKAAESAQNRAVDMVKKACSDAQAKAEKIIQEGVENSKIIKADAEKHIDSAVKLIVSQVIGEA
jgi:vacuolar-type H+-ATPase subunit H